MLYVVVSREAEEVSRVTQTTKHALDRGDWTQLKTPIVARWTEGASDARAARTQRGAGGAPVRDLSKRFNGRALAPPVFAKVQSQQRERPNWSERSTTMTCTVTYLV
jgi:hypothetical protein